MSSSPCPLKERCGSCSWSHIPYPQQLEQKLGDINGSFGIKSLNLHCATIVPSPVLAHYRNRMDFAIDFEGRMGLKEKGKWWKVIDGHTCFLADKQIETLFHIIHAWVKSCELSYHDRKSHVGLLRHAVIRATTLGQTMITIVTSVPTDELEKQQLLNALAQLNDTAHPTTLIWSQNTTITDLSTGDILTTIAGPGTIEESINGTRCHISPNAFFQTNSHGAAILLETVREYAGDLTQKTLLDLYCGTGFFTVALASQTKKTVGIEMIKEAIDDARVNATLNRVQVDFIDAKTEEIHWNTYHADTIILDPPRSGMHDLALAEIMRNKPGTIVYISCNHKNFAREMVQLQTIYRVGAMKAIDLFPHTPHVELVIKLERKGM